MIGFRAGWKMGTTIQPDHELAMLLCSLPISHIQCIHSARSSQGCPVRGAVDLVVAEANIVNQWLWTMLISLFSFYCHLPLEFSVYTEKKKIMSRTVRSTVGLVISLSYKCVVSQVSKFTLEPCRYLWFIFGATIFILRSQGQWSV